jgi:serine/threonine protein kinase
MCCPPTRFVNEAKSLARFRKLPGIVAVNDFFQENGTAYIVMEYVEGKTVKDYLAEMGGRLPAAQVFEMLKPVMDSLSKVHNAGIIHRDISPDNIMLDTDGSMKLLDFGAAREFANSGDESMSVMLKHGFAPEEQYRSRGVQGPWTDVYALCATMYKCMTGITPLESNERRISDDVKPPSELGIVIDPAQEAVLMKGMAVLQEDRWQSVSELYGALYEARDGTPVTVFLEPPPQVVKPAPAVEPAPKTFWLAKNKTLAAIAAGACVLVFAVWAAWPSGSLPETEASPSPEPVMEAVAEATPSPSPAPEPDEPTPTPTPEPTPDTPTPTPTPEPTPDEPTPTPDTPTPSAPTPEAPVSLPTYTITFSSSGTVQQTGTNGRLASLPKLEDGPTTTFLGWSTEVRGGTEVTTATVFTMDTTVFPRWLYFTPISPSPSPSPSPDSDLIRIGGGGMRVSVDATEVNLHNRSVSDISELSRLTKVETLRLGANGLSDLSPISGLATLTHLYLGPNPIRGNLSPLSGLTNLTTLVLSETGTSDISALSALSGLTKLSYLDLRSNGISDISGISALKGLTGLKQLYLSGNPLTQEQKDELREALPNCRISFG